MRFTQELHQFITFQTTFSSCTIQVVGYKPKNFEQLLQYQFQSFYFEAKNFNWKTALLLLSVHSWHHRQCSKIIIIFSNNSLKPHMHSQI